MAAKTHFIQSAGYGSNTSEYGQSPISPVGNVFYVDSTNTGATDSTSFGYSPEAPFKTLAYALQTAAVATNNDIVRVMPGHAEAIVGAAGITLSKAGITIDGGAGQGRNRGTITFSTSTAAQMIVSGANTVFRNLVFDFTGIDAIVAAISVTGADVTFDNCEFVIQNATIGCVLGILTAATATRFKVTNCRFLGVKTSSGTTVTACIQHEIGENFLIANNHFEGKMTQAILNATAIINGLITTNTFHIYTGTKAVAVNVATQCYINGNSVIVASGTAPFVGTVANYTKNNYSTEGLGLTAGAASGI